MSCKRAWRRVEDGGSAEQRAHLKTCPECSALVAELNLIIATATELRAAEEPSPRVWNSIEICIAAGGSDSPAACEPFPSAIPQQPLGMGALGGAGGRCPADRGRALCSAAFPVAANWRVNPPTASCLFPMLAVAGLNDDDLLQEVAQLSPALQAQYADNLRHVNEYIQDAKSVVAANPNDEEARRSLMEAYQEKAMLFDLAMDRSLP